METEFLLDSDLVFNTAPDAQQTIDVEVGEVGTVETEVVDGIQLGMEEIHGESQQVIIEEAIDDTMQLMQPPPPPPPVELTPEEQLQSHEKLDRSSPDLWPQNLPEAAQHFFAKHQPKPANSNLGIWAQGLDPEDINLLHQFGSLTSSSLVEEVKKLQNIAYQLGIEEAKEMTRGKLLHVLQDAEVTNKQTKSKDSHVQRLWQQ